MGAPAAGCAARSAAQSTGSTSSDESHAAGAPRGGCLAPGDGGAGSAPGTLPHGALESSHTPLHPQRADATPAQQAVPGVAGLMASPFVVASRAPLPDWPEEGEAAAVTPAGRGVLVGGSPAAPAALGACSAAGGSAAGAAAAAAPLASEAAQDGRRGAAGPGASSSAGAVRDRGFPAGALGMVLGSPRGGEGALQGPGAPPRDLAAALVEQTLRALPRRPDAVSHVQCAPGVLQGLQCCNTSPQSIFPLGDGLRALFDGLRALRVH